jgi:integrase
VSLAEAREGALEYRKIARKGGDPLANKRQAQLIVPTFKEAACAVHEEYRHAWRNEKHVAQWISSLTHYAFPFIGDRRVDQVDTTEILNVLSSIWVTKPETARRVRQRMATVLDWAKVRQFRSGENPVEGVSMALPRQPDRKKHFSALPYSDVSQFVANLPTSGINEPAMLAFEFLILTAARTNEVLGATWEEVDLDQGVWTVSPERMKSGRAHRVPLAPRCVEIIQRLREIGGNNVLVFPGRSLDRSLSSMVFLMALRRMGVAVTTHGFRSTFRDWAAEQTNFSREVCELALGHVIKDKVEAAYRRGDLFDKRRKLMETWATFVTPAPAELTPYRAG